MVEFKFDFVFMLVYGEVIKYYINDLFFMFGNIILLIVGGNDIICNSISGGVIVFN